MPADWSKLVIRQAAADHHRIAAALRPLYAGRWLATGASKGGMTATYFRRFYPDDVHASVPYVAPHSASAADPRYAGFLEQVGPADCRDKLKAFQRALLAQRDAIETRMTASGTPFAKLGLDVAFEHAVIELRFGFWQYGSAAGCAMLPAPTATADQLYTGFDRVAQVSMYGDADIDAFGPYYYQATTQLGAPGFTEPHLLDLLRHAAEYGPLPYCPTGVTVPPFDAAAMPDVGAWLAASGERFLFIYGENDPWSAGAFPLPDAARDNHKLVVPAGNHGSGILDLPEPARTEALGAISRWSGVTAVPAAVTLPHRAIVELRRRPGPLPHLRPDVE